MKHLGFTGTQEGMTPVQRKAVRKLALHLSPKWLHHGDCIGSDHQMHNIAKRMGIKVSLHPPDNMLKRAFCIADKVHPPRPYLDRNHDIVWLTEGLLATPSGPEKLRSGTWATIRFARKLGRPIWIVWPDGHVTPEGNHG